MTVAITPRPLNPRERGVLDLVLSQEFPGAAELLAQIDLVEVYAQWGPESASVDLRVLEGAPPSVASGVVPVRSIVVDEAGSLFGEILLWVGDGYLAAIEFAWYGDEPPRTLPEVRMISTEVQADK